jgi:hypothetical protein
MNYGDPAVRKANLLFGPPWISMVLCDTASVEPFGYKLKRLRLKGLT